MNCKYDYKNEIFTLCFDPCPPCLPVLDADRGYASSDGWWRWRRRGSPRNLGCRTHRQTSQRAPSPSRRASPHPHSYPSPWQEAKKC
ncbi:UNVERIFIED_CONTAM: hypothetical protein NCL1_24131 [Trichonephila clavipes]